MYSFDYWFFTSSSFSWVLRMCGRFFFLLDNLFFIIFQSSVLYVLFFHVQVVLGTLLAALVPVVGFNAVLTSEHFASFLVSSRKTNYIVLHILFSSAKRFSYLEFMYINCRRGLLNFLSHNSNILATSISLLVKNCHSNKSAQHISVKYENYTKKENMPR